MTSTRPAGMLLLLLSMLMACTGGGAPRSGDVGLSESPVRPSRSLTTLDGRLTVPVSGDLDAHRLDTTILVSAPDGSFRVTVALEVGEKLLLIAGKGKETLLARGWLVEGEQHYEKAILARFRKGGNARRPTTRREIWWIVAGSGTMVVCDGIASSPGFEGLGETLRSFCRSVSLAPAPADSGAPTAP